MIDSIRVNAARVVASLVLASITGGCATLKEMTSDFERRWDDPKSIMAEMEAGARKDRAMNDADILTAKYGPCAHLAQSAQATEDSTIITETKITLGECLLENGRSDAAHVVFAEVVEYQENATALQGRGIAELRMGERSAALETLQTAVALDSGLWRAWNALGVANDYAGNLEGAIEAFEHAVKLNPTDGAPLNNLGVACLKAGREQDAIAAFSDAMSIEAVKEAAEANLRFAYSMAGEYAKATRSLSEDQRPIAFNNAGFAAASRGDKAEARRLLQQALDESPHFYAKAYSNLTLLLD